MSARPGYIILIFCVCSFLGNAQEKSVTYVQTSDIRLSVPIAKYSSSLFADSMALAFAPGLEGSKIRFTTDGSEPKADSPVFPGKQYFNSSTLIKAAAFHWDFLPSETIEIDFVRVPRITNVKNIRLVNPPNKGYPGGGAQSLMDLKKGGLNFRDPVWMGFSGDTIEVHLEFDEIREVKKVIVSTMMNQGAWIFLPQSIEVETEGGIFVGQIHNPGKQAADLLSYEVVRLNSVKADYLRIRIIPMAAIPDWHPGAGHAPWFFIDEIIIK